MTAVAWVRVRKWGTHQLRHLVIADRLSTNLWHLGASSSVLRMEVLAPDIVQRCGKNCHPSIMRTQRGNRLGSHNTFHGYRVPRLRKKCCFRYQLNGSGKDTHCQALPPEFDCWDPHSGGGHWLSIWWCLTSTYMHAHGHKINFKIFKEYFEELRDCSVVKSTGSFWRTLKFFSVLPISPQIMTQRHISYENFANSLALFLVSSYNLTCFY